MHAVCACAPPTCTMTCARKDNMQGHAENPPRCPLTCVRMCMVQVRQSKNTFKLSVGKNPHKERTDIGRLYTWWVLSVFRFGCFFPERVARAYSTLSMVSDGDGPLPMQPVGQAGPDGKVRRAPLSNCRIYQFYMFVRGIQFSGQ